MNEALQTTLLLILGLQLKHIVCDGPLQTLQMVKDKSFYGKPLGVVHALVHGVGSVLIMAVLGVPATLVLALAALDSVLHYHIDYVKENIVKSYGWQNTDGPFWWSLTTDQALHHMTYVLLAWLALTP